MPGTHLPNGIIGIIHGTSALFPSTPLLSIAVDLLQSSKLFFLGFFVSFLTSSSCTFKDVFPAPNSQSEVCDAGQEPAGALSTQGKGELHSLTGTHERPGRFLAQNLHCSPFPSWRSSVGWGGTHRDGNEHPEALGTRGLPQSQRCDSAQPAHILLMPNPPKPPFHPTSEHCRHTEGHSDQLLLQLH